MSSASKQRRILDIIATDSTFELTEHRGLRAWVGKKPSQNLLREPMAALGLRSGAHIPGVCCAPVLTPPCPWLARDDFGMVSKCIHCNRRLTVAEDGSPLSNATIEHIVPRSHGGGNEVENLALACGSCNFEKGRRHDIRDPRDPKLQEIVDRLREIRRRRWREPS